jgi:hypothetical protein
MTPPPRELDPDIVCRITIFAVQRQPAGEFPGEFVQVMVALALPSATERIIARPGNVCPGAGTRLR